MPIYEITKAKLKSPEKCREYLHHQLDKQFDELMKNITTTGRIEISIKYAVQDDGKTGL